MAKKYVYFFGAGKAEGNSKMRNLLGGKGCDLAEMTNLKIPVPAGFTITTEVCTAYYENKKKYPAGLKEQVQKGLSGVEKAMGAKFGDPQNPLLLSVRSGARVSMPGMMDTILNLGLNDRTIRGLIENSNDPRFAYDSYRRFIQMYSDVVLGVDREKMEEKIHEKKQQKGVKLDIELTAEDWKELVAEFKGIVQKNTGKAFPEDPEKQLWGAIGAVFESWDTPRAITYRKLNKIPEDWGTAVNVQAMVFGNMGGESATGVAFTRDPATGEKAFFGEFLPNAQGEDVVAGTRTPQPINKSPKNDPTLPSMEETLPRVYKELEKIYKRLEKHFKDMQDIEFTVQQGKLWMLQTRSGKRTAFAALRIAVEMVEEKLIDRKTALLRMDPDSLNQLLAPIFDPQAKSEAIKSGRFLAKGLNAGPGAACGKAVFTPERAMDLARLGQKSVLVRIETSPEDIHGMNAAEGILTSRGGMTSHAALVARGMGKPCVVGCTALNVDYAQAAMEVNGRTVKEGDFISIDGTTGEVIEGDLATSSSEIVQVLIEKKIPPKNSLIYQQFVKLMSWADQEARLGVLTNADTPRDAMAARLFGAKGIGLCRTEHMFFESERIAAVREMILADTVEERRRALAKILPMQKNDFAGIFRAMGGYPVIIRTLDPPLHEFLPHTDQEIAELAEEMGVPFKTLKERSESLKEANPMLGHRGCRLGISYPEITEMQARAIFEAACEVTKEGIKVIPEVMIPLVGHVNELRSQRQIVDRAAKEVLAQTGTKIKYMIGTMIELPRAAITADQIATVADFFSYGTNDLTQTVFGLSRDDAGKFLPFYRETGILETDPFVSIDRQGVGEAMRIGVEKGRKSNPKLEVGICGEHGGDPSSVEFCHMIGLDYVSCSPYRVPIARLAAAQAALTYPGKGKKSAVKSLD
ncbi:MAG: pyruvate, phosphate dikinase [Thermodesulfobacteriota bacterium]|nr:pyruvate, phosphate dikinase [Thermodesulfobacteriota bacterium]